MGGMGGKWEEMRWCKFLIIITKMKKKVESPLEEMRLGRKVYSQVNKTAKKTLRPEQMPGRIIYKLSCLQDI